MLSNLFGGLYLLSFHFGYAFAHKNKCPSCRCLATLRQLAFCKNDSTFWLNCMDSEGILWLLGYTFFFPRFLYSSAVPLFATIGVLVAPGDDRMPHLVFHFFVWFLLLVLCTQI